LINILILDVSGLLLLTDKRCSTRSGQNSVRHCPICHCIRSHNVHPCNFSAPVLSWHEQTCCSPVTTLCRFRCGLADVWTLTS